MDFDTLHMNLTNTLERLANIEYLAPDQKEARKTQILERFRRFLADKQRTEGFDINERNSSDQTALMRVLGSPDLMEILLNAGADPSAGDYTGTTPLHMLIHLRVTDVIPYLILLTHGADITRAYRMFGNTVTPLDSYLTEVAPDRRNPLLVELLTNPLPEDMRGLAVSFYKDLPEEEKVHLLSRLRAHLRRRQAVSAFSRAGASGGRRRRTVRRKQRKAKKTRRG